MNYLALTMRDGAYHPSIWKFLKVLQREEAACRAEVVQLVAGHPPPAKRRKYKDSDSRVLRLVESYYSTNIGTFLLGIAYNVIL